MSSGVRLARLSDVDDVAGIQVSDWRSNYAEILPSEFLAALDPVDLGLTWASSIINPPTPVHRVVVATDQATGSEEIRGYAAFGPCGDPDSGSETAEILALVVDPHHLGCGHGSRLMAACVDLLRESGFTSVVTWLLLSEDNRRRFLVSSGWAPDSAYRDRFISDGTSTREVRLITDISR